MTDCIFSLSTNWQKLCRSLSVPFYTHIFLLEDKNDSQGGSQVGSQGGSLSARSFDLARPGLAPPLLTMPTLRSLASLQSSYLQLFCQNTRTSHTTDDRQHIKCDCNVPLQWATGKFCVYFVHICENISGLSPKSSSTVNSLFCCKMLVGDM